MNSRIHLSEHFTYSKLLRFTLPSIVMNIFLSLYIIVDGYFVANFVGKTEFAAINLIMPVLNILGTIGYMFGVGGSALIAKTLGEKNQDQANRLFSLIVLVSSCLGVLLMVAGTVGSGILLGVIKQFVDEIPLEFFYVLFWLFADALVRYLFIEFGDYKSDKIRAGRIASMKVEFVEAQ